jgi:lysine 6-dehydrogenase
MSQFTYAILGAGRQGTSAAYDLAKFGEAQQIILADVRKETAAQAAGRINQLIGRGVTIAQQLDVSDRIALAQTPHGVDIALSAVPYFFNLEITKACIAASSNLCDMGGHTGVASQQVALAASPKGQGSSQLKAVVRNVRS